MEANDFLLDDDGDLQITSNGDFKIGLSDRQHITDIIRSNVGWWKQYPLIGVGIMNYLNSSGKEQQLEREIKIQLQSDGYNVDKPKISYDANGLMNITPNAMRL